MPVVPCAKAITGQPDFGALPFGSSDTLPDTATALPATPDGAVEDELVRAGALQRIGLRLRSRAQMTPPCAVPFRAPDGGV